MQRKLITCLFALLFLLSACSPARPTSAPAAPTMLTSQNAGGLPAALENPGYPQPQKAAAPTAAPNPADTSTSQTTSPLAFSPAGSQMVIKDAQLDLLVTDSAQALNRVTALAGDEGGYIVSSQTWYTDGYLYASLRLGIPSARFEAALNQIRAIGLKVLKENAQGQDVTDQYIDLQSRLTNLEATAARVRDFLKDAKTIEESLRISQQLSELEAQIEQVKGQMRFYEGRTAYSTVTVTLTPQYPTPTPTVTPTLMPTATATPPWNPGATISDASGVLTKQFQVFVDVAIWIVMIVGPWALLAALVYLIVRRILRKTSRIAK